LRVAQQPHQLKKRATILYYLFSDNGTMKKQGIKLTALKVSSIITQINRRNKLLGGNGKLNVDNCQSNALAVNKRIFSMWQRFRHTPRLP